MSEPGSAPLMDATEPGDVAVRAAIEAVAAGRPVVVVDDADRENEGDLIFAATLATPALLAFTVRHTSGFVCVALTGDQCDRLRLSPMHHDNQDRFGTAYQVTVDLHGTGTGISAAARAATTAALGSPTSSAAEFTKPGHVVPLRARDGGVLTRPGHTEAAVDLVRLAGLPPAGALCEIVSVERPGEMARGPELERFAQEHGLVLVSIEDLIRYRRRAEPAVRRAAATALPTEHGQFTAIGYADPRDGSEHLALVAGPATHDSPVHVHVECLTGDVLRSTSCVCRKELDAAMIRFAAAGNGIVVYLRPAGSAHACSLFPESDADPVVVAAVANEILADLGARSAVGAADPLAVESLAAARRRRRAQPLHSATDTAPLEEEPRYA